MAFPQHAAKTSNECVAFSREMVKTWNEDGRQTEEKDMLFQEVNKS